MMDGVDVSSFQLGHSYTVEPSVARYLVVAGYARLELMCSDAVNDKPPRRRRRK